MISLVDFNRRADQLTGRLTRLVEIESPSTEKAAVDRLGAYLAQELQRLGAALTVEARLAVGDPLVARWNQGSGGEVLLLCHMDTVYASGTLAKRPIRVIDGCLFGPGAMDMKAGIAILLEAIAFLGEAGALPRRAITALFTTDEETGSFHSRTLIEKLAAQASLVLCLEPALANGALKTARKGTGDIEIVTRGRAAHAGGEHEKGRNAIEELAHHILAVQRLTDYSRGTTVSVGVVSGGTRPNVVPDEARAQVDFRVESSKETTRIQEWAAALRPVLDGTQVTARVTQDRPPMPRDARMVATFQKAQSIAAHLGLTLDEGSTGGASDANFVAPLGVPVLDGLGGVGDGAHSEREYVRLDSLPERAALLAAILTEWNQVP